MEPKYTKNSFIITPVKGMICLFLMMIYVVVLSKYSKCVINFQCS